MASAAMPIPETSLIKGSNDKAERRAVAKLIVGHYSLCAFDSPCSHYSLPRDRSSRMLDCRATPAAEADSQQV
jgi:hypothetical protein